MSAGVFSEMASPCHYPGSAAIPRTELDWIGLQSGPPGSVRELVLTATSGRSPIKKIVSPRPVPKYSRRNLVTERDDGFSEAVAHRPTMPAGIKGRPYVCWSRDRTGAADPIAAASPAAQSRGVQGQLFAPDLALLATSQNASVARPAAIRCL